MALLLAATFGGAASTPIAFALECRPGWERRGRRATAPLPRSAFTIAPCLAAFLAEKASPAVPWPSSALEAITQQPSSDSPSEAPPMCSSPSTGASLGVVKIQASELVVSIVSRCGSKHHSVSVCNRQFIELHYMTACAIQDSCHPGTRLGVTHLESSTRSTQLTPWVNSIAASSVRFAAVSPRLLAVSIPVELSSSRELMPGVRYLQRSTVCESVRPEILRPCRCLLAGKCAMMRPQRPCMAPKVCYWVIAPRSAKAPRIIEWF